MGPYLHCPSTGLEHCFELLLTSQSVTYLQLAQIYLKLKLLLVLALKLET
jgi:hypothetical protein